MVRSSPMEAVQTNDKYVYFRYYAVALCILAVIVFLLLKYAVQPSPVPVMKPSQFANLNEMGRYTLQRIYPEIVDRQSFWIGIPSRSKDVGEFIDGFIAEADRQKIPFSEVWIQDGINDLVSLSLPSRVLNFNVQDVSKIEGEISTVDKRVLIITPNVYSSYKMELSPVNRFKVRPQVLTLGVLAYRTDLDSEMDPTCVGGLSDKTNTTGLGCEIYSRSLTFKGRRKMQDGHWQAIMDRWGQDEFLLLFARPKT